MELLTGILSGVKDSNVLGGLKPRLSPEVILSPEPIVILSPEPQFVI